jgi:RNA polymerase sigma-70 factor (ECF subfamily)
VRDARSGDTAAFARLVDRYEARVRAVAIAVGVDPAAADDVAQETFVAAYRSLSALQDPAAFAAWVAGTAHHQAVTWRRRQSRAPEGREDVDALAGADARDGPPEALAREARREEVRRALVRLDDRERLALCLKHHAGLTYAEIAETMTLPTTTIKGLLERGTRALRARLAALGGGAA